MAKFLEGQIRTLSGAVVTAEVPSAQRNGSSRKARPRRGARAKRAQRARR